MITNNRKLWLVFFLIIILLLFTIILSLSIGSISVSLNDILSSFLMRESTEAKILWDIRYPRIMMSLISGVNLGLSGLLIQSVLKNPLTDSNILGVNAGASLVAVFILVIAPQSVPWLPLVAFIGGMGSFMLVSVLSSDRYGSAIRLILTGIAVRAVLGGLQSVIITLNSDRLQGAVMWLNGDLSGNTWSDVGLLLLYSMPAYILAFILHEKMDLLQLDDMVIHSLGVSTREYRFIISVIGVYLASVAVSFVGLIGFIGLIIPHLARILVGGKHLRLLLYTSILSPLLLILADTVSRTVIAPLEIPIGTTMSLIGGPFFIYLLYRQTRRSRF